MGLPIEPAQTVETGATRDSRVGPQVACGSFSSPPETLRKTTHWGPPATAPGGGPGTESLAKRRYMTPTKAATTATARAAARI